MNVAARATKINIAMAVEHFRDRGYAPLGGLILNRRDVPNEEAKVAELAADFRTRVVGALDWSADIQAADERRQTVVEAAPDSTAARQFRALAEAILPPAAPC